MIVSNQTVLSESKLFQETSLFFYLLVISTYKILRSRVVRKGERMTRLIQAQDQQNTAQQKRIGEQRAEIDAGMCKE